jgi:hypothetical protein
VKYSCHSQYYWRCVASGAYKQSGEYLPRLQAKRGKFSVPIRSFRGFFSLRCASTIGGVRIAGPIVLAQQRKNKRMGKARKTIHSSLPIVTEISPNNFAVLTGNGNMFNTR